MMRYLTWLNIALCLCFTGCNRAALVKKVVPQEDEVFARKYVELLRQRAFDQIEPKLDPSISAFEVRKALESMADVFPAEEPKSTKVVAYNLHHSLTLEYEFPDRWLLVDMSIKRVGDYSTITSFRVTPIPDSLEYINRFTLVGKSGLQYVILGLAVAAPIFTFYVLAVCLRTKNQTRKWLWAIFILVGVGKLGVNWTAGTLIFTPLAVNIPCGGATTTNGFYGPWVVAVHFPLGAILFLRKRSRSLASNEVHAANPAELP
jgi:hypothetical protein